MGRKEKLLRRFLSNPKDFTYDEAVRLLKDFDFYEVSTGKTSGSRVRFENEKLPQKFIRLHKPHPGKILKEYQVKGILEDLIRYELINLKEDERTK